MAYHLLLRIGKVLLKDDLSEETNMEEEKRMSNDSALQEKFVSRKKAADESPVDLSRLRKIYKSEGQIHEILELYVETAGSLLSSIQDSLLRRDAKMIVFPTHKLKGASGNIGATTMAELCLRMEEAIEAPDWEKSNSLYEGMLGCFKRVNRFVNEHQ